MASIAVDPTLLALKERARRTWAAGNYDAVADGIWEVGERVVRAADVVPGERVLDVAAGTGNAAIRAATAGATVTALDITPEMFEAGRRRAADAGVDIDWVEGDAEELPFGDGSFDVVLSTFGVMFAPRHRVAAAELARVLRPGGRLAIAAWVAEGPVGRMFRTMASHLPAPPPLAEPPLLWGDPSHVTELFAEAGIDLTFRREELRIDPHVSVDESVAFYIESFGPLVIARQELTTEGRWEPLAAELTDVLRGLLTEPAFFLTILGRKG